MDSISYRWTEGDRTREFALVHVPGTSGAPYTFGDPPQGRSVNLEGFFIAVVPVTQALWSHVVGSNPAVNRRPDLPTPTRARGRNSLGLNFACQAIATSEMPLAQIAGTAGFTDQSHFTRTFKRLMGITPAAYAALLPCSGRTRSRIALCKTWTLL